MSVTMGLVSVERCTSPERLPRHVCRHHGACPRGGRCFLARRGNTAVRGQVSVVAMRPRAPHCLVLSTPPRRQAPWWVGRVLLTRKPAHATGRKPGLVLSTPPRRQAPWWVGRVLSTPKPLMPLAANEVTWRGNLAACLHRFSRFLHGRSTRLDTERLTDCRVFSRNATMWRVASRAMPLGATWLCWLAMGRS